ncbi:MAG: DUF4960 domain-containing protein [Paludibacteraceae bacterium]|nr:DUF4960 domain-containing protein [Paludibacteraceae bacterium]
MYYLLPNSADANCENITNQYDHPTEGNRLQWETSDGDVYQCPERNAFDWFARSYCDASIPWIYNEGDHQIRRIVTFKDLTDGRLAAEGNMFNDVKVIWVNVDRWMTKDDLDNLFPDAVRTALANYVKAGGNLYLSTFAARLAYLMGRAPEPGFVEHNGFCCDDEWKVMAHFRRMDDGGRDKHEHAIYKYLRDNNLYDQGYRYHMLKGSPRTDRNCLWDIDDNLTAYDDFQKNHTCGILGGWGHNDENVCAGLVEFYPIGDWKGTIITNGLAAYSFAASNTDRFCVEHLTRGILDYLKSTTPTLAWENAVPESGVINSQYGLVAVTNDAVHYPITYSAETPEIANIGIGDGNVYFNYFGNATFHATVGGDGWNAPKNAPTITIDATIPVNGGDQNVKYAYVLPYSLHTMSNYDNEEGLRPDFEAANWFYQQYVATNIGCFVRPSDLASLNPAIKVLWIHNDHVGKESDEYYNDLGGDTFREKLRTFINNGGNVFVSKQATRLIGDLGRASYPAYQNGGYDNRGPWRVGNTWNLEGEYIDHSTHAVYANIGTNTEIMAEGRHTDNNCIYNNDMLGWTGNRDPQKLHDFETANNCLILGTWGHDNNVLECVGFVEFYPQNTTEGTIIAMGLAAFHWANPTDAIKTLTRDILYYLNIEETPLFTWLTAPADGNVGTEQFVNVEHKDSEIHWTSSDNNVVEIDDDPGHPGDPEYKKLILKAAGTVTITATRTGDGYKIPKNVKSPTHATQTITVTNGYTRNGLLQDYYYTVCLPKGAVSYTGAEMFKIADKTANNDIVIEEVDNMEAGIPYIFLATAEQLNVVYDNNDPVAARSANGLVGHIGTEALELSANENYYILAKNQIWQVDQTATVPSNRAYIDMSAIHPKTPAPGKKRYVISSQHTATGIEGTNANESSKAKKIVRDGQLLIKQGEHVYNAQGQIIK